MTHIGARIRHFLKDEEGATMPEYALMIALIAVVCIAAVTLIGTSASTKFTALQAAIAAA